MKKPFKAVKPSDKDGDEKTAKALPFWMKSKMGMKKKPSDKDGDE